LLCSQHQLKTDSTAATTSKYNIYPKKIFYMGVGNSGMFDSVLQSLQNLIPGWVWIFIAAVSVLVAWETGNDNTEPDQDPFERVLSGLFVVSNNLMNLVAQLLEGGAKVLFYLLQSVLGILSRLGKWIEENVSIDIVLDGTFWRLVIVLVLIAGGYLTLSSLGF